MIDETEDYLVKFDSELFSLLSSLKIHFFLVDKFFEGGSSESENKESIMAVTVNFNLCIFLALCGTPQAALCQTGSEPAGLLWPKLCHPVAAEKLSGQQLLPPGERSMDAEPVALASLTTHQSGGYESSLYL